jgi:hypothetical protein
MEKKTYYSVTYYSGRGNSGISEMWFDNKKDADNFADHDYHDNPVAHHVSSPKTIKKYDGFVAMTAYELTD